MGLAKLKLDKIYANVKKKYKKTIGSRSESVLGVMVERRRLLLLLLATIREWKSAFDLFCYFITGISVSVLADHQLQTWSIPRDLVLLKFTIRQLEMPEVT